MRLKSAFSCRLCRRWLEGEWATATPEQRREIERQMAAGVCDACQLARQSAAVELIRAADIARMIPDPDRRCTQWHPVASAAAHFDALSPPLPPYVVPSRFRDRPRVRRRRRDR